MGRSTRIAAPAVLLLGLALAAWIARADSSDLTAAPAGAADQPAVAQDTVAGEDTATDTVAAADPRAQGQTAQQAIVDHNTAARGPRQPIPFNHRFHSAELRIDCMYCHYGIRTSQTGVLPSLEVCMGCHRVAGAGLDPVEELKGYWERNEPVPWEWVNKVPEFVQFTHQPHLRNGITCQECHGPVEEMSRVYQWAPLTMGWCLECHRSEPAETDVATDYILAREATIPEIPAGIQEKSLYPVRIPTYYGEWRASIDCLTCHY